MSRTAEACRVIFFFQAEDGIRDIGATGVQTCALPISAIRTDIDGAAAWLELKRDALIERSAEIAAQIEGSVPIVYGCDLTAPVAYRWKTQINENAKQQAFNAELPEMDHNEIVGWD